jgi:hypothetical protein
LLLTSLKVRFSKWKSVFHQEVELLHMTVEMALMTFSFTFASSQFRRHKRTEFMWRAVYSVISKTSISLTRKSPAPVKTMLLFSPVSLV